MTTPSEPGASNSWRYFAVAVLCAALVLGIYFVQLNAKVDRQREEAAEKMALCRRVERVASAASSNSLELRNTCKQLNELPSNSITLE